ncbi:ATP-binding protein [Alteromonas sp. ASW11-36]|uniref:histidine kinase n=1 Tax=Alteromonas arenosi TaxID=3055817 RepID=A0ABT7SWC7_9ALTE|nr:ATP-binding protein [Alteromonas sp. ASW11-36]MDM7859874.1 ATP-binding protein [Alteromonas sp. ASW11-36]
MLRLSLRVRSVILAVIGLVVIVPAIFFTVERSYTSSLEQAKYNELKLMSLAMITEFELDDGAAFMPQQLFEEQLNLPGSGFIGYIVWQDTIVWRSLSALDYIDPNITDLPDVGAEYLRTMSIDNQQYESDREPAFYYAFSAEYENQGDFEKVSFLVFNEQFGFQQSRHMFIRTLWQWLALLAIVTLAIIILIVQRVLAPVNSIIGSIEAAEKGQVQRLTEVYPPELESLKSSINQLLESEADQRQRYKNALGDLAHSLKTPLAIIKGEPELPEGAQEPLTQISSIIERQLKRAVISNTARLAPIVLHPLAQKLCNAMDKIHTERALEINNNLATTIAIKADETDIMELFGNLLDNACKAAQKRVDISAEVYAQSLHIYIDDDGSGIAENDATKILQRGSRLDTYKDGQGLGLSVVSDILESYDGQLRIERSPLGGARFVVILPAPVAQAAV